MEDGKRKGNPDTEGVRKRKRELSKVELGKIHFGGIMKLLRESCPSERFKDFEETERKFKYEWELIECDEVVQKIAAESEHYKKLERVYTEIRRIDRQLKLADETFKEELRARMTSKIKEATNDNTLQVKLDQIKVQAELEREEIVRKRLNRIHDYAHKARKKVIDELRRQNSLPDYTCRKRKKEEKKQPETKLQILARFFLYIQSRTCQPWQRKDPPDHANTCDLSPNVVMTEEIVWNKPECIRVRVFRDDYLTGGTKQRAIETLFQGTECEEFVYAGPYEGYAQVALAAVAKARGKKAVVFVKRRREGLFHLSAIAHSLGATIMEESPPNRVQDLQQKAEQYVSSTDGRATLLPFGLDSDTFKDALYTRLKEAIPKLDKPPDRLWLVAGSATLLRVLHRIWPETHMLIVQVGKYIWDDLVEDIEKKTIYEAPEFFSEKAVIQPPYRTVTTYDAKLWQFVLQFGKNGDYVWNVAGHNAN
eukprot:m.67559 g.67559  ORF g.67559 m.67559 type:complete len:480 (-) comp11900_c0_seq1:62-1501(-)